MPRPPVFCRAVAGPEQAAVHHRIRHEVFVLEQAVFAVTDRDAHDANASTIKVLGWAGDEPGGAVRLYPLEPGIWQGDRLAVLPPFRAWNLGGRLVQFAVDTAAALGGEEMLAHVQMANVRFFERLGWRRRSEPEDYVGLRHQLMAIDLAAARRRSEPPASRSSSVTVTPAAGRSPARS
jgi:putative N-acetyltransferase (TIGR04045 family)